MTEIYAEVAAVSPLSHPENGRVLLPIAFLDLRIPDTELIRQCVYDWP
jgi:hypothetical protein